MELPGRQYLEQDTDFLAPHHLFPPQRTGDYKKPGWHMGSTCPGGRRRKKRRSASLRKAVCSGGNGDADPFPSNLTEEKEPELSPRLFQYAFCRYAIPLPRKPSPPGNPTPALPDSPLCSRTRPPTPSSRLHIIYSGKYARLRPAAGSVCISIR